MKDQFVIACIDREEDASSILSWARPLADNLRKKELMILNVSRTAEQRASNLTWLTTLGVPYVALVGDWRTSIAGLPTAFSGILAVTAVDKQAPKSSLAHPRTLIRQFKECKIAYFTCPIGSSNVQSNSLSSLHVSLSITHRREGREKLIWASYLSRFCHTTLSIAHPEYTDDELRHKLQNNILFIDKMYSPLGITYREMILNKKTAVDIDTLNSIRPDILISMTSDTRERDIIDWMLPLPELQLLTHPSHTPILFLNQRDDLYILCD